MRVFSRSGRTTRVLVAVLRMALAFIVAFSTVLFAQSRLAIEAHASGAEPASSSSSSEAVPLCISDVGVFEAGTTRDAFAFASEGKKSDEVRAVIDRKGGQIDFDAAVLWNDGSDWEYDSNKVTWRLADGDGAIAHLSPSGILEAAGTGDGTVTVSACVSGDYTEDGKELAAVFKVELRGQTDARYVTAITICDDEGAPIDPSYRFEPGTLATAQLDLNARVTVHDPATEVDAEYRVTPASGLARQTDGELADLQWDVADQRLGSVSEEGVYRPASEGTNLVYAVSTAGFNGSRVSAQATMDMPSEDGSQAEDGYHPQNTLTVKVYYDSYPDQLVKEKTFAIDDLEALGTSVRTYTAMRGTQGYLTTTGRGPLLTRVLSAAGVNVAGVKRLRFGTPDNYQGTVSWDLLVDTDRYYFPNIDIGSYSDAVQVPPMIAIDSYRNVGSDTSAHPDEMSDLRRFLLLFGAKKTGETTTNLQIYNIHTLYVDLEGAPAYSNVNVKFVDSISGSVLKSVDTDDPASVIAPDAPVHDGYSFKGWSMSTDARGNVTYTTAYEKNGDENDGDGSDAGGNEDGGALPRGDDQAGDGANDTSGMYDLSPSSGESGETTDSQAATGSDASQLNAGDGTLTELSPDDLTVVSSNRLVMLKAINKHPSDVSELMIENPLAPFVAPFSAGVLAAGGVQAGASYLFQRRRPKIAGER